MATPKIELIHCKDFEAIAVRAVMWDVVKMSNKQCAGCKQTRLPYAPDVV